ncbi:MAG: SRPBCC family protein [Caldilineaceae bacterium]
MTTVQQHIRIDAPIDTVYDYISNYTNDPQWRCGVVQVTQDPPPPARLGARTHERFRMLGLHFETRAEVTSYRVNTVIGFTALSSAFPLWGQRRVHVEEGATRFTYQLTARFHGPYRLLRPLLVWQFERRLQQDLERLKRILESK